MIFCGGCVDKVYHGHAFVSQEDIFIGDKITLLKSNDTLEFDFTEGENSIHAMFSTNANISQSFENGLSVKEDGQFLRLLFDRPQTTGAVPKIINNACRILSFLIFRNNLHFEKVFLTKKTTNDKNEIVAEVHLEQNNVTNKKSLQCISVNSLQNHLTDFFSLIWNSKIGTMSYS